MAGSVRDDAAPRESNSLVRTCPASSRQLLQLVIDTTSTPRKELSVAVLGRQDEPQFSKMVGGTRPWDLDHLDRLPRAERVDWLRRRCAVEGLEVRDPDVLAMAYTVVGLVEQLVVAARGLSLPQHAARMAKASLPYTGVERRRA